MTSVDGGMVLLGPVFFRAAIRPYNRRHKTQERVLPLCFLFCYSIPSCYLFSTFPVEKKLRVGVAGSAMRNIAFVWYYVRTLALASH